MSRKLVTGSLAVAFLPLGIITSGVTVGFLLTALVLVSPLLIGYLAFYAASIIVNKLSDWFNTPSLKYEGFTAFSLDVLKRVALSALVSIPLLPFSLIAVGLAVTIIAPLLFIALAGFFPYWGAKRVVLFFAGEENNHGNPADSGIIYVDLPAHQVRPGAREDLRPGTNMDHYQSSVRRFFEQPSIESLTTEASGIYHRLGFGGTGED